MTPCKFDNCKLEPKMSAMSKVESPASACRSIASTASSRSMLPHPPLDCHMPLTILQMSTEPLPLPTVTRSGLLSTAFSHRTTGGLRRRHPSLSAAVERMRRRFEKKECVDAADAAIPFCLLFPLGRAGNRA
ncbi:hypothetical protein ACLOJK_031285 [Asimina triloba]